ncbi:MAG TPA: hypothetical protein VNO82_09615 [Solirubrobacteraceae bacterium]|nr:hypothetical protein [Solirubrobacteraceae bacterium]
MLPTTLVVLALLVPAQASASALSVQQDCADSDVFERKHSRGDLESALDKVQADVAEYTECERMILAALAALKSKGGSGRGAEIDADLNNDGVITPKERRIAAKRAKQAREKRNRQIAAVTDDLVQDDAAAASAGGSGGPSAPLILALVALLCAGAGGGLWYASKRNPAVANALRRVPVPFRNS